MLDPVINCTLPPPFYKDSAITEKKQRKYIFKNPLCCKNRRCNLSIGDTQNLEGGREDTHEQSKTLSPWFATPLQPSVAIGGKFPESPYLQ